MAIFYPDFETILMMKVPPTSGELHLLNFLKNNYNDEYEVYFNPYMNGDRPDIIIMRKNGGVFIIEVKDWDLSSYKLNSRKQWIVKHNKAVTKSPIQQVLKYKENLYDLHIPNLLEKKIKDYKNWKMVCCAVYFHNAYQNNLQKFLVEPFKEDEKYLTFLKHNIDIIGRDDLEKEKFDKILRKRYINGKKPSYLFTQELYKSFSRFLKPPIHLKEQGKPIFYSQEQQRIIYSQNKAQKIKGVVGSGKTTTLVARAVEAYKRILKETDNPKILILTFNITLKNYIHDKLNQVPEEFEWKSFEILNYHSLINFVLNNIEIDIYIDPDDPLLHKICSKYLPKDIILEILSTLEKNEEPTQKLNQYFANKNPKYRIQWFKIISEYFDEKYYSNIQLFEEYKNNIQKYDAILIDEIQDYKYIWFEILKKYILKENGEYILFGDEKQNIYARETEDKKVKTNILGAFNLLKQCYRSDQKVKELAVLFQKEIYKDKYDIDDFDKKEDTQLSFEFEKHGSINYMFLENTLDLSALYNIIHQSLENKYKDISINDVCVLGFSIENLKEFEAYYRYHSRERTNTMFETKEIGYKINLESKKEDLYTEGIKLLPKHHPPLKNNIVLLAKLLTIYELYEKYNDEYHQFDITLENECKKAKIETQDFLNFIENNRKEYEDLKNSTHQTFETIRKNKKMNFWFNSGTIKISTVHSFKGWESELVFLILEPSNSQSIDEILYTGITRSKSHLVIINFGNQEYDKKLRGLIDKINSK